jgi:hypothetical protein
MMVPKAEKEEPVWGCRTSHVAHVAYVAYRLSRFPPHGAQLSSREEVELLITRMRGMITLQGM